VPVWEHDVSFQGTSCKLGDLVVGVALIGTSDEIPYPLVHSKAYKICQHKMLFPNKLAANPILALTKFLMYTKLLKYISKN
jgi:hypothetical protein